MPEPKADKPRCDVPGCGKFAVKSTDGKEVDTAVTLVRAEGQSEDDPPTRKKLLRPAVPNVNVCAHHDNWPHSEDAARFAASDVYKARK